jgi:hypothetical protein
MSKVAIFVEGQTESALTLKLLEALCGKHGIAIELHEQRGGTLHFVRKAGDDQANLFAMVANCSNDGQVKTQIKDRYKHLVTAGFTRVIGIRDVYPDFKRADLPQLEQAKMTGLPSAPLPVDLHYAVMEVEAWFLDEITHFERIHAQLTVARIKADGFDVESKHGETWDHPADTLNAIYKLEGLAWGKKGRHVQRTVEALCMDSFYLSARTRSASLASYISSLELALFPPSVAGAPV